MKEFIILLAINIIMYFFIVHRYRAFLKGINIHKEHIVNVLYLNSAKENEELGKIINYTIFNKYEVKK